MTLPQPMPFFSRNLTSHAILSRSVGGGVARRNVSAKPRAGTGTGQHCGVVTKTESRERRTG